MKKGINSFPFPNLGKKKTAGVISFEKIDQQPKFIWLGLFHFDIKQNPQILVCGFMKFHFG